MWHAGQALRCRPSLSPWFPMERLDRHSLAAFLRPIGSAHRALGRVQVSGAVAPHSVRMSANASGVSWLPVPRTLVGQLLPLVSDWFAVVRRSRAAVPSEREAGQADSAFGLLF